MNEAITTSYFYSIQPHWKGVLSETKKDISNQRFSVSEYQSQQDSLLCVPGNGQLGIRVGDCEELKGCCYGVLDRRERIQLWGIQKGIFIRFAPGVFTEIFGIPAQEISPYGVPIEDVFSTDQLRQMKRALEASDRVFALKCLMAKWAEHAGREDCYWETRLAREVRNIIWESRGAIRVQEISDKTGYTGRYIQDVVKRQIGLTPKKLCIHTRIQRILQLVESDAKVPLYMIQQLGYSDQAHFSREFKENIGLCPTDYLDTLFLNA